MDFAFAIEKLKQQQQQKNRFKTAEGILVGHMALHLAQMLSDL